MRFFVTGRRALWLVRALAALVGAAIFVLVNAVNAQRPHLDVPYVPTPPEVVERMLEMAQVNSDDVLVDLGSGDGRIVIAAAKEHGVSGARGIDLDPERIEEARANAREAGVKDQVSFEEGDLFNKDFSDATVLTMYLLQSVNLRLKPVILDTMQPGSRVVSHDFDMGEWLPDQEDNVNGRRIYLWTVPAQVAGRWRFTTEDGDEGTVFVTQMYQQVEGEVVINGERLPLEQTHLQGEQLSFFLEGKRYDGRVYGDAIEAVQDRGQSVQWYAQRL